MKRRFTHFIALLFGCIALVQLASCSNIDCPLTNKVYAKWSFYKADQQDNLTDTLYVYLRVNGTDSLVVNKLYNAKEVLLPMSYYNAADTLSFEMKSTGFRSYKDMVIVQKDNAPHFNSPECGTWVAHYIQHVTHTHNNVDSITVTNQNVDINEVENFRIYFK